MLLTLSYFLPESVQLAGLSGRFLLLFTPPYFAVHRFYPMQGIAFAAFTCVFHEMQNFFRAVLHEMRNFYRAILHEMQKFATMLRCVGNFCNQATAKAVTNITPYSAEWKALNPSSLRYP